MGRKITDKYIQTQLRYWCNKLAAKKAAECIVLTYLSSDDSLNGSIFVNRQVINEFIDGEKKVYLYSRNSMESFKISELCPYPFNEENL